MNTCTQYHFTLGGAVDAYICAAHAPVIYLITMQDEVRALHALLKKTPVNVIGLQVKDWENALTPWPMQSPFDSGTIFKGEGATLLGALPARVAGVEARVNIRPQSRTLLGYSLGGLFALWAIFSGCALFDRIGCVSGSLWYSGLKDFLDTHDLSPAVTAVYFSVGGKEKNVKSPLVQDVEARTRMAERIVAARGVQTTLEINHGGHFTDIPERLADAANWLFKHCAQK